MDYLYVLSGFVLMSVCAEVMVRGAVALAERVGVSPLLIGLTVVAMGTSLPELVVSVNAAMTGAPAIAVGNVVGSNIANILLILGLTGMIWPIPCPNPKLFFQDAGILILVSVLFTAFGVGGAIAPWQGVAMLLLLAGYLTFAYRRELADKSAPLLEELEEFEQLKGKPWSLALGATGLGLLGVLLGADLLVEGAVGIARTFGISEEVIGLTLVAFGTSLPELATSLVAAWRRHNDLALGNIVGSCLFNILGIMGLASLIAPVPVSEQFINFDFWVMIGSAVLLIPFVATGGGMSRREAALMAALYAAYVAAQFYGIERLIALGNFPN